MWRGLFQYKSHKSRKSPRLHFKKLVCTFPEVPVDLVCSDEEGKSQMNKYHQKA